MIGQQWRPRRALFLLYGIGPVVNCYALGNHLQCFHHIYARIRGCAADQDVFWSASFKHWFPRREIGEAPP